jgi:hypothetical protein
MESVMQSVLVFVAAGLAIFVAGVVLSQKIKDWTNGVPSALRAELNTLEASVKAQVSSAQKAVVADLKSKVVVPTPTLVTAAVSAMVNPVPVPAATPAAPPAA